MQRRTAFFLLTTLFFSCSVAIALEPQSTTPAEAPQPELRIEGVIYDDASPEESMVVIHGEFYKVGDRALGNRIVAIHSESVVIHNEKTKEEKELSVTAKPQEPEIPETQMPEWALEEEPPSPQDVWGKIKQAWMQWNPAAVINRVTELKAMLDVATVYNAAVIYYNDNNVVPWELKQLVQTQYLPDSFLKKTRGRYRIRMALRGQPLGIHAEPVNPNSGLRYFYVGADGVMRSENNKAAGPKSRPTDYGI